MLYALQELNCQIIQILYHLFPELFSIICTKPLFQIMYKSYPDFIKSALFIPSNNFPLVYYLPLLRVHLYPPFFCCSLLYLWMYSIIRFYINILKVKVSSWLSGEIFIE